MKKLFKKSVSFFTLSLMATFLFAYKKVFAQSGEIALWYGSPESEIPMANTFTNSLSTQDQFLNFLDKYFSLCILGVLAVVGIVVVTIYLVNEYKRNKIGIKEKPIKK
jgi:hypothetical protein